MEKSKKQIILEQIGKGDFSERTENGEQEKIELVICKMDDDYYAFYGSDIREILPYEEITFVPGCPEFIRGIINVRGDIESVLNLHRMMGLSEVRPGRQSRVAIAIKNDIRTGILVDAVEDVIELPVSLIKRPLSTLDKNILEFAVGGENFYKNQYVTILDVEKIFAKIVS